MRLLCALMLCMSMCRERRYVFRCKCAQLNACSCFGRCFGQLWSELRISGKVECQSGQTCSPSMVWPVSLNMTRDGTDT
jgi:hypothetical protein